MNGVYESAVLEALKCHSNLNEIVLCTDNDECGIKAAKRLRAHSQTVPELKAAARKLFAIADCTLRLETEETLVREVEQKKTSEVTPSDEPKFIC